MEKPNTASLLVEAMAASLQEHGYRSTSTTQILETTGVSRGSLYFHFPDGKEALAVAAVHASGSVVATWIAAEFSTGPDAIAASGRLIDGFAMALGASEFTKGCPVALCALEAGPKEPKLQAAIGAVYSDWSRAIRTGLVAKGMAASAAAQLADLALIQIEGALLLARAMKSLTPMTLAKNALIHAIGEVR